MKKQLLLFMVLLPAMAWAAVGDEFTVDGLKYKVLSEDRKTVMLSGFNGEIQSNDLVIPATVNGYSVTNIGLNAFDDCAVLTSVTIPSSVTFIDNHAFKGCSGLTSVHISDLEAWCGITFDNFQDSNPLIHAHHLFLNGEEIKDLVIPNNVKSISNNAFTGCSGLTSVTIPNDLTYIGEYAFHGCTSLTTFVIPDSVTSICQHTFSGCSGLTSVIIPSSVTSIRNYVFYGCNSLTSITIPSGVIYIGEGAFRSCSGLTDVYCYADPEALQWVVDAKSFKANKATLCHVEADKLNGYIQNKFKDINVTFVGDLAEGIESLTAGNGKGNAVYNLAGQHIGGLQKGLNIVDGKKVWVK